MFEISHIVCIKYFSIPKTPLWDLQIIFINNVGIQSNCLFLHISSDDCTRDLSVKAVNAYGTHLRAWGPKCITTDVARVFVTKCACVPILTHVHRLSRCACHFQSSIPRRVWLSDTYLGPNLVCGKICARSRMRGLLHPRDPTRPWIIAPGKRPLSFLIKKKFCYDQFAGQLLEYKWSPVATSASF